MTLRCLFVDFNAYFASVEQYDSMPLRGRPIGVFPVMAVTLQIRHPSPAAE